MTQQNVSVTLPLSQALARVKRMLFQPFEPGKWFVIGFCAWLASLGEGGVHGGYSGGGPVRRGGVANVQHEFERARDFVLQNLWWIVPVAATIVVLGLAIWLVLIWLSSRGQFMFLHCVALDKAEVRVPWHKYVREAHSLFLFRLVLGVGTAFILLPLIAGIVFFVAGMVGGGAATLVGIIGAVGLGGMATLLGVAFFVVGKFTRDFVVPIQFARGINCVEGWRVLLGLLRGNIPAFVLYLLFQIVLAVAIFALIMAIVLITCCIAGCLLAIPYLGTVLLLPILVFKRAYSLYYLAQFGREYEVVVAV
jgi:hypothetical protein